MIARRSHHRGCELELRECRGFEFRAASFKGAPSACDPFARWDWRGLRRRSAGIGRQVVSLHAGVAWLGLFIPCLTASIQAATNSPEDLSETKLAPPYSAIPPTFWEQHGSQVLLLVIVVVLLAGLGVWLRLRPKAVPIVPPEVQARNDLAGLQALPEDGMFLSRVSQIIRRYFVAAFALPPGEFTTTEFKNMIEASPLDRGLAAALLEFLRECDQRKFSPAPAANAGTVTRALQLVERAESLRRPPPIPRA